MREAATRSMPWNRRGHPESGHPDLLWSRCTPSFSFQAFRKPKLHLRTQLAWPNQSSPLPRTLFLSGTNPTRDSTPLVLVEYSICPSGTAYHWNSRKKPTKTNHNSQKTPQTLSLAVWKWSTEEWKNDTGFQDTFSAVLAIWSVPTLSHILFVKWAGKWSSNH